MSIQYEQKIAGQMQTNYDFTRVLRKDFALKDLATQKESYELNKANFEAINSIKRSTQLEELKSNERLKLMGLDYMKQQYKKRKNDEMTNTILGIGSFALNALIPAPKLNTGGTATAVASTASPVQNFTPSVGLTSDQFLEPMY